MKRLALLSLALLLLAPAARAKMKVVSLSGRLTADGKELQPGDVIPLTKVELESGAAVLETDAGQFLLKGPASFTPGRSRLRLWLGSLLSVLPKLAGRPFEVQAGMAVAAVRGTDFFVSTTGPEHAYVCLCRGKLDIRAKGTKKRELEAENHAAFLYSRRKGKNFSKSALLEGHTDEELANLRAAVGP